MECHGSIESVRIKLNVDVHLKTLASSVDVVKPELQNDSKAADYATDDRRVLGP